MIISIPSSIARDEDSVEINASEEVPSVLPRMPMRSSRYVRPVELPPLFLQQRDRLIILSVFEYRYLSIEHIQALVFPGTKMRAVQMRLRKLWAHQYLDRQFITYVFNGTQPLPRHAARPFYMLSLRGAEVVSEERGLDVAAIPHTPQENVRGYATLEHHLVATDFLVSVEAACSARSDVAALEIEQESKLRRTLAAFWRGAGQKVPALVPDGAFTWSLSESSQRPTYYVEVVRTGVKGGNEALLSRLRQYAAMHHQGFFERVYRHSRLRAVLFITPTAERAKHLSDLVHRLSHGQQLFWFGSYEEAGLDGRKVSTLTPSEILTPRWHSANGQVHSLLPGATGALG